MVVHRRRLAGQSLQSGCCRECFSGQHAAAQASTDNKPALRLLHSAQNRMMMINKQARVTPPQTAATIL